MGAAVSIIASVAAIAIPAILSAIRGSRVEENPTMRAIEEQHRREEEERAEAQRRAEQMERERQAHAESLRREREAAQRAAELAEQLENQRRKAEEERAEAQRRAEQMERERQEHAENLRREREAAQRAAELAEQLENQRRREEEERAETQRRAEQMERERQEHAESLRREREAAQRAAELTEQLENQRRREEEERAETQRRAEQMERERQEHAESLRRERDAAQRAAQLAEQLERERQAQAERIRIQQEEAQRAAQNAEHLEREKQEQMEIARREREAAQRAAEAANELQEQVRKKEAEMKKVLDEQKAMEAKWKIGIHPVEWPSKEKYEATKRRFYKEGKFHLAIAGISGTGKSSLINAFRGIWDGDEGAAMTDIVETTSVVTPYPDPNPANPFIWFDVPGSGTLSCSDWTYFNDQGLYIFDAVIVLFGDRFTATDIAILRNCERYNIPTYIVRSKSDIHIENIIKMKRRAAGAKADPAKILDDARKEYLARTQESVRLNLMKNDPPIRSQKMYAVSRDTLTMVVREEPTEDMLVLNEFELLRDILQDAYSRRSEKSYGTMSNLMKKTGMDIVRFFTN